MGCCPKCNAEVTELEGFCAGCKSALVSTRVVEHSPDYAETLGVMGRLLAEDRYQDAVNFCLRFSDVHPADADYLLILGDIQRAYGHYHDAATCYQRALLRNPPYADVLREKLDVLSELAAQIHANHQPIAEEATIAATVRYPSVKFAIPPAENEKDKIHLKLFFFDGLVTQSRARAMVVATVLIVLLSFILNVEPAKPRYQPPTHVIALPISADEPLPAGALDLLTTP